MWLASEALLIPFVKSTPCKADNGCCLTQTKGIRPPTWSRAYTFAVRRAKLDLELRTSESESKPNGILSN